jgi:hypothetical protein
MRLLNVASAHARIDAAVELLKEAKQLLHYERKAGLPVDSKATDSALHASLEARECLWIFLKRMP